MASRGLEVVLALALVAMLWHGARAQTSCTSTLVTLAPCLNYITGNSSTPSSTCCSSLSGVVQSSPQCLCSVLNGGASNLGVTINQTAALRLPTACNVQTPPVSQCNAVTPSSSAASPSDSPTASPSGQTTQGATTPSASQTPSTTGSGSGSKTVPSTTGSSDGSIAKASIHLVLFLAFIAMCASSQI